jgi:hypothetical protein
MLLSSTGVTKNPLQLPKSEILHRRNEHRLLRMTFHDATNIQDSFLTVSKISRGQL